MRRGWLLEWTRRGRQAVYVLGLFVTGDWPVRSAIALNCCYKIQEIPSVAHSGRGGCGPCSARAGQPYCALQILLLHFDLCPRILNAIFLQRNYKSFQSYHAFYWTFLILGQDLWWVKTQLKHLERFIFKKKSKKGRNEKYTPWCHLRDSASLKLISTSLRVIEIFTNS